MSIREVLKKLRIPFLEPGTHRHTTSRFVQIECVWCSPGSGRWRMGVATEGGWAASCWTCGKHKLLDTLVQISGRGWREIREMLGDRRDGRCRRAEVRQRAGAVVVPKGVGPLGAAHRRYLGGRRIDPDEAQGAWGVRGIAMAPRLCWRLWLPVRDRAGEVSSWTTRSISREVELRYINAKPEEEKVGLKELLYGEELCGHSVLVVEGPLDALRIGPGAVAVMGAKYGKVQVGKIGRFPRRGICFDSDKTGRTQGRKLCRELEIFPGVTELIELDAKDPGEAGEGEIKELRRWLCG